MSENAAGSTEAELTEEPAFLDAGTAAYRRANLAMFVGGFATFAMLYGTQPILPLLSEAFDISPASASLSVSAGTAALALLLIPASILSDRIGRMRVMKTSLTLAAIVALASPFVTDFNQLWSCVPCSVLRWPVCPRRRWPTSARRSRPRPRAGQWVCTSRATHSAA